jgi:hypothetical protein
MINVNWTDPGCLVSKYFTVHDAIYLPKWNRLANEADGLLDEQKTAIFEYFEKLDKVREILGVDIITHCGYRPPAYNKLIKGAKESAHMARFLKDYGKKGGYCAASDWHPLFPKSITEACDLAREYLRPHLQKLGLRMEDNPGSSWVHTDSKPLAYGKLFFKP